MEVEVAGATLPLRLAHRGKVRDVYEVDDETLLMVASDRVSAFDVILPQPIPRKGEVLTQLTAWWVDRIARDPELLVPHHILSLDPGTIVARIPALAPSRRSWARRSMLVRRTRPIPVECVVRGYLSGSAWREYAAAGTLAGEPLPPGLEESSPLEPPLFSPATKATEGHDENIPFAAVEQVVGPDLAARLEDLSLRIYAFGAEVARERGILLADTKFEFGLDSADELRLIDEVLTPDSSRFWPVEGYRTGTTPPSLDKQPIRDHLFSLEDWDRTPPAPDLPVPVVEAATARYLEVFERLTGSPLDAYLPPRFALDVEEGSRRDEPLTDVSEAVAEPEAGDP